MNATPAVVWHALAAEEVLRRTGGDRDGLTSAEASRRLAACGPNVLPRRPPRPLWRLAADQLSHPLVLLLEAATAVSLAIGHAADAVLIALVVAIDAVIGTWQEAKASRSTAALQSLLRIRAAVCRDGSVREIPADDLVPGDLVWVGAGERVPADARLLTAHGLEVDESLVTGESLPVRKEAAWIGPPEAPLADRSNMLHAGSIVTRGRGSATVVATGPRTEIGGLSADLAAGPAGTPPLIARMERFTRAIAVAVVVAAGSIGLLGLLVGQRPGEMFLFAVVLAVSAIPEGLPVSLTIALAVASGRMAARGVIVRRLAAVEGLGSCTLIATDKTGTLTCNELTVTVVEPADPGGNPAVRLAVGGRGFVPRGTVTCDGRPVTSPRLTAAADPPAADGGRLRDLVESAVLCNDATLHRRDGGWTWRGDSVDVALLCLGEKLGIERESLLAEAPECDALPFDPERRYAATFHILASGRIACVKGAPEAVLPLCGRWETGSAAASTWHGRAAALAADGLRVLAIARGRLPATADPGRPPSLPGQLELLGLVGLADPLRPGAREAVRRCEAAGIRVAMITGDHRLTAASIGRELDLVRSDADVTTGTELDTLAPDAFAEAVRTVRVFARVTPRQKLRIVEAARTAGHFVAVTGDGANDAPALRAANIGVAMGKGGTDLAREAAGLVVVDDDFATIVAGIEEGRIAYDNVRKVVLLLVSTGAAEMVLVTAAVATGSPLPLTAAQLLWLNLVTNGVQDVALAFEPGEGDELARPPRPPGESVFDATMVVRVAIAALVMGLAAFAVFRGWLAGEPGSGAAVASARNATLLVMVLFENMHLANCRSEFRSVFARRPRTARRTGSFLVAGALAGISLHLLAMHWSPAATLLGVGPVAGRDWPVLLAVAASIVPAVELHKWRCRRRRVRESAA